MRRGWASARRARGSRTSTESSTGGCGGRLSLTPQTVDSKDYFAKVSLRKVDRVPADVCTFRRPAEVDDRAMAADAVPSGLVGPDVVRNQLVRAGIAVGTASSSAWPRRSGSAHEASAARTKNAANVPNTSPEPPASSSGGTQRGARIDAIRPNPAAAPAPVARSAVGYTSGVTA